MSVPRTHRPGQEINDINTYVKNHSEITADGPSKSSQNNSPQLQLIPRIPTAAHSPSLYLFQPDYSRRYAFPLPPGPAVIKRKWKEEAQASLHPARLAHLYYDLATNALGCRVGLLNIDMQDDRIRYKPHLQVLSAGGGDLTSYRPDLIAWTRCFIG